MKRRLFTILCALSVLPIVTVVAMCVRSFWRVDGIAYRQQDRVHSLNSESGHVVVIAMRMGGLVVEEQGWPFSSDKPSSVAYEQGIRTWLTCRWNSDVGSLLGTSFSGWVYVMPYTHIVGATLLLPTFWLVPRLRDRVRRRSNRCPRCGYDLRATPSQCPECGTSTAPPPPPLRGHVR